MQIFAPRIAKCSKMIRTFSGSLTAAQAFSSSEEMHVKRSVTTKFSR